MHSGCERGVFDATAYGAGDNAANMNKAYQRVVSNKGAAGIDCMTVYELRGLIV